MNPNVRSSALTKLAKARVLDAQMAKMRAEVERLRAEVEYELLEGDAPPSEVVTEMDRVRARKALERMGGR